MRRACGVFWLPFARLYSALWKFPRQDHEFEEFRGRRRLSGYGIRNFRVAKSSGEGRKEPPVAVQFTHIRSIRIYITADCLSAWSYHEGSMRALTFVCRSFCMNTRPLEAR